MSVSAVLTGYGAGNVADGFDRLRTPKKQPRNNSRIVIEGVDEPTPAPPQGRYSDRVRIDPWSPTYKQRAGAPEPVKRA